jgi:hypothetical protein
VTEIESGSVSEMVDSTSADLLAEIREKCRLWRRAPLAAAFGSFLCLILLVAGPQWVTALFALALVASVAWLNRRDRLRRTVVLFFDLDPEMETAYEAVHTSFDWLATSQALWHLQAEGTTPWKTSGGATKAVRRQRIRALKTAPRGIETNIAVPSLAVGRQTLYFFPDRILVLDGSEVGAVGYEQLVVEASAVRFVEEESVPSDTTVVGSTWKYVNKKGGPDRRFKDNRELPIAIYGEVHLKSATGLNEALQVSRKNASEHFAVGLRLFAAMLRQYATKQADAT